MQAEEEESGAPACVIARQCPTDPLDMGPASCWDAGYAPELALKPMLVSVARCLRTGSAAANLGGVCSPVTCTDANGCAFVPTIASQCEDFCETVTDPTEVSCSASNGCTLVPAAGSDVATCHRVSAATESSQRESENCDWYRADTASSARTASSKFAGLDGYGAPHSGLNMANNQAWCSGVQQSGEWLQIDLGFEQEVAGTVIARRPTQSGGISTYEVHYWSEEAQAWAAVTAAGDPACASTCHATNDDICPPLSCAALLCTTPPEDYGESSNPNSITDCVFPAAVFTQKVRIVVRSFYSWGVCAKADVLLPRGVCADFQHCSLRPAIPPRCVDTCDAVAPLTLGTCEATDSCRFVPAAGSTMMVGSVQYKINQYESEYLAGDMGRLPANSLPQRLLSLPSRNLARDRPSRLMNGAQLSPLIKTWSQINKMWASSAQLQAAQAAFTATADVASVVEASVDISGLALDGRVDTCSPVTLPADHFGSLPLYQSYQYHSQPVLRVDLGEGVAAVRTVHVWGDPRPDTYLGPVDMTSSPFGEPETCQGWGWQAPNAHDYDADWISANPDAGLGDHNFCRDPDGSGQPWCFSADRPGRLPCNAYGQLEVRVGFTKAWEEAEPCVMQRTLGEPERHGLEIDTHGSQAAIFSCNATWTEGRRWLFVGQSDGALETAGQNLRLCEVAAYTADELSMEFAPVHGAFHFGLDPSECLDPNVAGPVGYDHYLGQRCDNEPFYMGKLNPQAGSPLSTYNMEVVVAGNTTLQMFTSMCPRAGCIPAIPVVRSVVTTQEFNWSCGHECWNRTGVYEVDVPGIYDSACSDVCAEINAKQPTQYSCTAELGCDFAIDGDTPTCERSAASIAALDSCNVTVTATERGSCLFSHGCRYFAGTPWEGEIPNGWTVWVDQVTPVMENLTVRGDLRFRDGLGGDRAARPSPARNCPLHPPHCHSLCAHAWFPLMPGSPHALQAWTRRSGCTRTTS